MLTLEILQKHFGHNEFRGHQADIIQHLIQGNDAIVLIQRGREILCYKSSIARPA